MRLIDIFRTGNRLYAWLWDGKSSFSELVFEPEIFVYARFSDLCFLERMLRSFGFWCRIELRKTLKGMKKVLAVRTPVRHFRQLVADIERIGNYSFELFNSDIPLPEYCLFSKGLFPGCVVDHEKGCDGRITAIRAVDSPFDDYSLPELSACRLGIKVSHSLWKKSPPRLISVAFEGEDYDDLGSFMEAFARADPDMILTSNGSLELPFLLEKARQIDPCFSFSRFGKDSFERGGASFFSYGRTLFLSRGVYLKGRLHLERKNVIYGNWGLWHDFETSRICRASIQRANHRSSGFCVSNLQLCHAMARGFLIPRKTSCSERWKSGYELFNADRGALIYEPTPGFYDAIAEIDFVSLFPNIMVKKNISTETVFCRCCTENKAPGLGINICTREKGIIPEMLEPLIAKRLYYKSHKGPGFADRADAIKGLLVTSFGYMGFRKSKFARIESHQAIQAYARETLLEAAKIAESMGFSVVHGIVDSLWVRKEGISEKSVNRLISRINSCTGFEMKLEGMYRWVVFLPSSGNKSIPVATRYYGVFDDGSVKCRGIEARRHDTPQIMRELQLRIIDELAGAGTHAEFRSAMINSIVHVRDTINRILACSVSEDEMAISRRISKVQYRAWNPQAIIVSRLKQQGFDVQPGQLIKYVITNRRSSIKAARYGFGGFDRHEYARLAKNAVNNLFLPFVEASIMDRQPTLFEVWNDNKGIKAEGLPLQVKERPFRAPC